MNGPTSQNLELKKNYLSRMIYRAFGEDYEVVTEDLTDNLDRCQFAIWLIDPTAKPVGWLHIQYDHPDWKIIVNRRYNPEVLDKMKATIEPWLDKPLADLAQALDRRP